MRRKAPLSPKARSGGRLRSPPGLTVANDAVADGEDETTYSGMTVTELKALCRERGIKVGGLKSDLIERLNRDDIR